ncbi:ABC-F family ATP-binding cassette domain-containing protein [Candidatus Dojkabacteria bacterium]|uniref:ABC-F family ATP-binding cassette domain-containing protein n=1 Tax=Candidatus Dojkabacteria bacterium TaxID=2099670 RepID=A0A955L5R6_9BACT|nr:ABC-F family ATP-binding cassette domain-containing protein [Candidatus Dojkabacteria bacterium]
MLKVNNLKIEYASLLFSDVNFTLGNKERVGLVGLNGCGKSTLLKIIMGYEVPDEGDIHVGNEIIGYLPQHLGFDEDMLVGEYLESLVDNPYTDMWKIEKSLDRLGLTIKGEESFITNPELVAIDYYSPISILSDGQKLKLYLCKLIINESTILLLDEPTNHLDIEGINWLEGFLRNYEGIIMVISHGRLFLNNLVNIIYEIDDQKLNIFHGNYDEYLELKDEWRAKRDLEYTMQERKREKLEARLELVRKFSSGKKQSAAVKAVKSRIKREVEANEVSKYQENKITNLDIDGTIHASKVMISIKDLEFSYGQDNLLENSNLEIYGKEKVWFYGANGIGKSTLIKLLTGSLVPDKGKAQIGDNVKWKYFSQDQSHLPAEMTVRDFIMQVGGVDYGKSFGVLAQFLFPKELQNYTLKRLSPGQRARLSFAAFSLGNNQLLILDEPTNHLDIQTKESIEHALEAFDGTILLISHDRYFVEQIGINRKFTIEDKRILES